MFVNNLRLILLVVAVVLVTVDAQHFFPYHYNQVNSIFSHPVHRPNVAVGSPLARIFLLCNGINCPARG
uniref:Secreted protein n=1 Tax=Steinernema glaseri TaxID=37863 RepID=A0A1I8A888_9BILA